MDSIIINNNKYEVNETKEKELDVEEDDIEVWFNVLAINFTIFVLDTQNINFMNFPSLRFYVKSITGILEMQNLFFEHS